MKAFREGFSLILFSILKKYLEGICYLISPLETLQGPLL